MIGSFWTIPITGGTSDLVLGTTSTTAFRGDYGQDAYNHSQSEHAPVDAEANVNPDWDAQLGDAQILNKPTSMYPDYWIPITDFNDQAVSDHEIAMTADKTSILLPGRYLKYKLSDIYYYGSVEACVSDKLTIAGVPLTTGVGDLTELYYTTFQMPSLSFIFNGMFAITATTTLINDFINLPGGWSWQGSKAHCVGMTIATLHNDFGSPVTDALINMSIGGLTVFDSPLEVPNGDYLSTGVTVIPANCIINRGDKIEVSVAIATGGTPQFNANTLTLIPNFIPELD